MTPSEFAAVAEELVARNYALLAPGDDLGLSIFVTPGIYPTYAAGEEPGTPTVCLHTYPLPFHLWAEKYREGQALVTTDVEQVSPHCWPAGLKCRSRMHYYLADKRAAAMDPQARALLLDAQGFVTEASTANLLIYHAGRGLASPPSDKILRGISLGVVSEPGQGAVRNPVYRARSDRRRRGVGRRGAVDQHADVRAAGHAFQRPADRLGASGQAV